MAHILRSDRLHLRIESSRRVSLNREHEGRRVNMKASRKLVLIFIVLLFPYFALVLYMAAWNPDYLINGPDWFRWGLVAYFFGIIAVLSGAIRRFRRTNLTHPAQLLSSPPADGGALMKPSHKLALIVLAVLVPYFLFILSMPVMGPKYLDSLPTWFRWGVAAYFVASFLVLSWAIIRFRAIGSIEKMSRPAAAAQSQDATGLRNVKRLLVLYIALLPLGLAEALLQTQMPVKFALLALIVPVLVMGGCGERLR